MLNDYNDPSERRSLSLDDTSSTEESQDDTRLSLEPSTDVIPYIGQKFETHDTAYEFYSKFAKRCGFSIRRHRTEGKDGIGKGLTRRYFVCHRAGNTPVKATSDTKSQRNRKSSRCGCQAYMRISRNIDMGVSEWRVTGFANHHNHELLEPNQVRFLPAYRTISDADKLRIQMFAKSGISVQQMMRLMELEKHVEPGYLPFTEKDVRNLIQSFRKVSQNEEGIDLLRMCKSIKEKEPNFKYDFTLDQNNMLTGIAWSYASSVQSYEIFGDAVVFDTTHRLAAFDLPLGIWVGMNNYGMPCFFGCVLLQEENVQSFTWALKVFLNFMNGKAPRTILTDQNTCLREAISVEMPKTKHALCVWLTMAKFPSWFNSVLGERYNEWKVEFYRLYNLERPDDFEHGWREMVAVAVDFRDQMGEQQIMQQNLQNICLKTGTPMEAHAASVLTPFAFSKLQDELVLAAHYASVPMGEGVFLVRHHTKMDGGQKVLWIPHEELLSCNCNSFEFSGILCRHALRVLSTLNFFQIPERYLLIRWRRVNFVPSNLVQGIGSSSNEQAEQVQALQSMVSTLVSEASKSKERMDFASREISVLLSRIKDLSVSFSDSTNCSHRG
ncbi:protein FAR1-RELATED SEQUENCE 11-like isoform X2 [Zingiber officinale]|uniref:protein FAR1-RELATED SEQUENCE 11-like isoform X2 n=1 Tax=Zingiber officinale TaxID=94328 RepID=UPI001C4D7328|nr:protein FAR1-RELATED SEQUENCE 11-like isoform X2 [Zingiber officinale]